MLKLTYFEMFVVETHFQAFDSLSFRYKMLYKVLLAIMMTIFFSDIFLLKVYLTQVRIFNSIIFCFDNNSYLDDSSKDGNINLLKRTDYHVFCTNMI